MPARRIRKFHESMETPRIYKSHAQFGRTTVGNARIVNPIPIRDRNLFVPQFLGGALGYRGKNWPKRSKEIIEQRGRYSQISGVTGEQADLQVHHLIPARLGGGNNDENLLVVDPFNHASIESRAKNPIRSIGGISGRPAFAGRPRGR